MVYACKVAALLFSAPGTAAAPLNSSARINSAWRQILDSVRKCKDRLEYLQTVVTFWVLMYAPLERRAVLPPPPTAGNRHPAALYARNVITSGTRRVPESW